MGATRIGSGTQGCRNICHIVQCYAEGCDLIHIDEILDPNIEWCIGVCSDEKWPVEEHECVWWCVVVHLFAPWSRRSDSHHIGFVAGVIDALVHKGH